MLFNFPKEHKSGNFRRILTLSFYSSNHLSQALKNINIVTTTCDIQKYVFFADNEISLIFPGFLWSIQPFLNASPLLFSKKQC